MCGHVVQRVITHSAAAVLVAIPDDFLIADSSAGTTASWYFKLRDFGTKSIHFRTAVAKGEFWEAAKDKVCGEMHNLIQL
mmetsp:Transcript_46457/g.96633  ORF Transcript_46457/g.96633 Transcript_46457/m.96633 type:complete len:80 (-) Transcript_46457:979-1218(-)